MYTVEQDGNMWLVLKDGHLFMANHSKRSADHIAMSLNSAKTPSPTERFMSSDIEDSKDLKQDQPPL